MALEEIKTLLEAAGITEPAPTITDSISEPAPDVCPVCGGSGWEMARMPEEKIREVYGDGDIPECFYLAAKPCSACSDQARVQRARAASSPSLDVTLNDFDWDVYKVGMESKRAYIEKYLDNYVRLESEGLGGLYLYSQTCGTGKTLLARCVCGELIQRYAAGALFITAGELLERSREKREDGSDPLAPFIGCRILVLDDLGQKAGAKDWMSDVLYRVINARYRARRALIVTSNLSLEDLYQKLDGRVMDRIYDMVMPIALPEVPVRSIMSRKRKSDVLGGLGIGGVGDA